MSNQVLAPPSSRQVAELDRFRGNNGTIINPHRSIATLQLRGADLVLAVVLGLGAALAFVLELDLVGRAWTWIFEWLATPLGFPGVRVHEIDIGTVVQFQLPFFFEQAAAPTTMQWWVVLVVTVIAVIVSLFMRESWIPFAYAIRLAAVVQATALVFFWLRPAAFPYDLGGYITTMEIAGLTAIALVPLILATTYYVIDARFRQKLGLTAAIMGHLFVFVPLQYAVQSYVIAHGSLLLMPLAFAFFSLLPEVMIFIALYGWGMSWPSRQPRGRRE